MRNLVVILVATLAPCHLIAQELSSGYVVTLQYDTLRGFILDGTDTELGLKVQFRKSRESANMEYTPSNLLSFAFDYGREFRALKTHSNASRPQSADAVFAKRNMDGKISIYTHDREKANQPDMFLVNHATPDTVHLTQPEKKVITTDGGSKKISESSQHIGLLTVIKNEPGLANSRRTKYNERSIRKEILEYNNTYKAKYPLSFYQPKQIYKHEILIGAPIIESFRGVAFRAAFFRAKYFPERSRNWSFIRGLSYRCWLRNPEFLNTRARYYNTREQLLSLIPIGLRYEGNGKVVRPYVHIGFGLATILDTFDSTPANGVQDKEHEFWITPTLNVGAGIKIKTGTKFILMELSPSGGMGLHGNLGLSF